MGDKILDIFQILNDKKIRYGIFAGCEVALLTKNRQPTDIDIIVHNDDFSKLADLFPTSVVNIKHDWPITTSDGKKLICRADNIEFQVGGQDFDIMSNAVFIDDGNEYPTYLTDLAVTNRLEDKIDDQLVYFANPVDTIIIKSFMRRGAEQNKFDATDCRALVELLPINRNYLLERLAETGSNNESLLFLKRIGL